MSGIREKDELRKIGRVFPVSAMECAQGRTWTPSRAPCDALTGIACFFVIAALPVRGVPDELIAHKLA